VNARVALLVEHSSPFSLEAPTKLAPLPNPNPTRFVRAYRFEALSQSVPYKSLIGRQAGDKKWSADLLAYYTKAPEDPRYAEYAKRALAQIPPQHQADPFARAIAVKLALDKDLTYSTKERHAGALDPAAEMLFGNKIGYCVHFAHAAVYLWRTLGIPSRVGTGYHSDEENRHGGSAILLRAGDAHAWPELYLEGVGWIVLDITAARNLDKPRQAPDDDLQRLLGEMARNQPPDPEQPPKKKEKGRSYGREISLAALALVLLAIATLYAVKIWRRLTPAFAGPKTLPRVGYRAALDVLAEAGFARRFGETREDFARRVADVTPTFEAVTGMHLAAYLRDPSATERPELETPKWRAELRAVRREVASKARRWRRWLGFLNPASFLDSR
jgi:transglutaminase-like putative cysteine protease